MILTKHSTSQGERWAKDGLALPHGLNLGALLALRRTEMLQLLGDSPPGDTIGGGPVAPLDAHHEVWAAGVTYLRSREARRAESAHADVYERVYDAARPELFFKSLGWRVVGDKAPIRMRADSDWNVPEPELVLVINRHAEIVGYCAGNDVSSRRIEGENPLYLPQAKVYEASCALGHGILLCASDEIAGVPIRMQIRRGEETVFTGETGTQAMKRRFAELVEYLTRELDFPQGVFLMTGTGLVPGEGFSLQPGDVVSIRVGALSLENRVQEGRGA